MKFGLNNGYPSSPVWLCCLPNWKPPPFQLYRLGSIAVLNHRILREEHKAGVKRKLLLKTTWKWCRHPPCYTLRGSANFWTSTDLQIRTYFHFHKFLHIRTYHFCCIQGTWVNMFSKISKLPIENQTEYSSVMAFAESIWHPVLRGHFTSRETDGNEQLRTENNCM